ncbi:serpentine type 7TM GPCR chemoreceptor srv domain-containing protein [Ditylenchus destructor]|uniref:Serpentine type 7TM GPCR chemoreceptor srv domain-containing protein n=1 Tax=Ditylenchus destructor TaxID=166010 RepID=A0AAD4MSJ8_9BILA|nr:serpentine type 7TM GPCR chemoreceptor srv domain-containing protein [Ditylenchus destructor]
MRSWRSRQRNDVYRSAPSKSRGEAPHSNVFPAAQLGLGRVIAQPLPLGEGRRLLLVSPTKIATIWKYVLPISILVTYSTPLICTVPVLTYDFFVRLQKDNETFTLAIVLKPMPNFFVASAQVAAISGLRFGAICGVLNIITLILYRQPTHTNLNIANSGEQRVESRLTVYAIITFSTQLSMAGYYILRYIAAWIFQSDPDFFVSLANQFCWVHDINNIVLPAWFLLWASKKVRECVCSLVLPRS